jgi:hypothetical protein
MVIHGKIKKRNNGSKAKLPTASTKALKSWFEQNLLWPYPEVS